MSGNHNVQYCVLTASVDAYTNTLENHYGTLEEAVDAYEAVARRLPTDACVMIQKHAGGEKVMLANQVFHNVVFGTAAFRPV